MPLIDELTIQKLNNLPIEQIAKRLGLEVVRHRCLCPFHDDTHPSLTFNTFRNNYRCYACGAHGSTIDLVKGIRGCNFVEACQWLDSDLIQAPMPVRPRAAAPRKEAPAGPDPEWLGKLIEERELTEPARLFLLEERHIDPRVIEMCKLSSTLTSKPCRTGGRPFFDGPSVLIPYFDMEGKLMSLQSRYLGKKERPRFRFPTGSNCHVYNLPVLQTLQPGEPLWIAEGCSDCWALLSAGFKAIAIPSATLLKDEDMAPLRDLNLHMFPDQDAPGENLYQELKQRLPQLVRHQLPAGCKDFSDFWRSTFAATAKD